MSTAKVIPKENDPLDIFELKIGGSQRENIQILLTLRESKDSLLATRRIQVTLCNTWNSRFVREFLVDLSFCHLETMVILERFYLLKFLLFPGSDRHKERSYRIETYQIKYKPQHPELSCYFKGTWLHAAGFLKLLIIFGVCYRNLMPNIQLVIIFAENVRIFSVFLRFLQPIFFRRKQQFENLHGEEGK